ncbi:MAG TPA: HPr family phosphocarrier protein [Roseiflexaceae bacterium]|nr:HPr family phosphocarrier protein [Roseiflexaceae bacterium]
MTEATMVINHPEGLHARPAALFYQKSREFTSKITIQNLSRTGSPEVTVSAFNLLQIGVRQGHQIRLRADGPDEGAAIAELSRLIEGNFS